MIIENIALANRRTRAILVKPCIYIIAFVCWLASTVVVLILASLPHPSDNEDEGDYAYYDEPEDDGQGYDEE